MGNNLVHLLVMVPQGPEGSRAWWALGKSLLGECLDVGAGQHLKTAGIKTAAPCRGQRAGGTGDPGGTSTACAGLSAQTDSVSHHLNLCYVTFTANMSSRIIALGFVTPWRLPQCKL